MLRSLDDAGLQPFGLSAWAGPDPRNAETSPPRPPTLPEGVTHRLVGRSAEASNIHWFLKD